jgi:hypothetical protein
MNEVDFYLDSFEPMNPENTLNRKRLPIGQPTFKAMDYPLADESVDRLGVTGSSNLRSGGLHGRVFHSYRVSNGRGGEDEVRVAASLFRNRWYLIHRRFYLNHEGEWCAGPQGLSVPLREVIGTCEGMIAGMKAFREAGIPVDGGQA